MKKQNEFQNNFAAIVRKEMKSKGIKVKTFCERLLCFSEAIISSFICGSLKTVCALRRRADPICSKNM